MPTAIELLSVETVSDKTFVIDSDLRTIIIPKNITNLGVESDDDVFRAKFRMPATYCGIDLSKFAIRIHYLNAIGIGDVYEVTDAVRNSDNTITFSWLVGRQVATYKGVINFNVCLRDIEKSTGTVLREFNTTIASLPILEGLETDEQAVAEYTNILEQWRAMLFGVGDTVEQRMQDSADAHIANISAKGEETLKTIPADYTAVYQMADEALRTKADAIAIDVEGDNIFLNNSSSNPLIGLRVFGKSTQNGIPSPDNPIDIASVENPEVTILGTNLMPYPKIGVLNTVNGITYEYEGDGTYHIYGTYNSSNTEMAACHIDIYSPIRRSDKYTLSAKLLSGNVGMKYHFFIGLCSDTTSFRNWFSIPIEKTTKSGVVISDTRTPESALSDATQLSRFWIYSYNPNAEAYTTDFRVQVWLENNDVTTEYSPYTKQALNNQATLHGIPVTSGGNYTDVNGQQWLCDEVDFERGLYIKRTKLIDLANVTTWRTWGINYQDSGNVGFYVYDDSLGMETDMALCTLYSYNLYSYGGIAPGVKSTVSGEQYYVVSVPKTYLTDVSSDSAAIASLKELLTTTDAKMLVTIKPIETELAPSEIAAYKALHTNKPISTIQNSAGAPMIVTYNADTKLYIANTMTSVLEGIENGSY